MPDISTFKTSQRVAIDASVRELGRVAPWRKVMGPREAMPKHTPVRYDGSATVLMVPTALLSAA